MAFSLSLGSLYSRVVRSRIGARTFSSNPMQTLSQGGRLVKRYAIGGSFKGYLVGFVMSQIPNLTWSLSGLWSLFTSSAIELYYFNWNEPDAQLDRQAQARWQQYGSLLGGTAGNAIGFFACGVVPASSLMVFNEDMGVYVLREVGQEAFEELTFNLSYALRLSIRNLTRQSFNWLYKGARRWLKDPENKTLNLLFPDRAEEIKAKWGESGSQVWSFAQAIDEQIETIPSQFWQNFTEELIEEAIDACIEAGYVVSNSVESYYARQRMAERFTQSPERVIEVQPNRDNDLEKITLAGPEDVLRAQLPAVLANHQVMESRDIGQFVGDTLDDYVRPRPFEGIRLKFHMYSVKSPPYTRRGTARLVRVTVTVVDVDRVKLDFDKLRAACGGLNGYLWGRWRAHAILTNNQSLTVYGGTKDEATDQLKRFLTLSDQEIKTISCTEEIKEGERLRNPKMYKDTTRVYPGHVTIINRERLLALDRGHRSREGNYIDKKARIDLWRSVKPPNFEQVIQELLRKAEI